MTNCKECGKKIEQVPGRRPREFCKGTNCRTIYWRKNNPVITESLPPGVKVIKDIVGYKFDERKITEEQVAEFEKTHPINWVKRETIPLPKDYVNVGSVGVIDESGAIDLLKVPDWYAGAVEVELKNNLKTKKIEIVATDEKGSKKNVLLVPMPEKQTKEAIPDTISLEVKDSSQKEIEAQIKTLQAEKIPKERDTIQGRKTWKLDQKKRIEELKNRIK